MRCGFCIALILLLPVVASAQSFGPLGDTSSFTVSVSPQYPTPYGQATLSFLSSSIDLTNATMEVTSNSKKIYQGNIQPITITLGKAGSVTNAAIIITSGGTLYQQTLSIQPQDVVLVAEPVSSVPPLYPGKPSVPLEGSVRVVAVASLRNATGKSSSPSTYSYTWTVDGAQMGNISGIGKQSIIVASPLQYRTRTVTVTTMNSEGTLVGGASLSLTAFKPSLRIYENDPLLGIRYDHALADQYTISGAESTLYAAPFSFPTTRGAPFLEWFLNGSTVQTGNSITLRPTGSGQGNASLSLVASAGQYTTDTVNLSLSFGAKPMLNLFGL